MTQIQFDPEKIINFENNILAWVDQETNLMWEVKNKENIGFWYVWHTKNVKNVTFEVKSHFEEEIYDCTSYIKRMNENNYAGFSDWGLPTVEELKSLINEEGNEYFIKKPLSSNTFPAYWTGTPKIAVNVYKTRYSDWKDTAYIPTVYIVDFKQPMVNAYSPDNALWIRCVRSVHPVQEERIV
jgi:hypothetical protein